MPVIILDEHLPRPRLASELGVNERTLQRWAKLRIGPPVTWIGRRPFYSVDSVRAWLKSREQPMVRERGA
jgi:hypothetical protein